MNCNCVAYDYCLICLSKRSGAVPFMHKVVYDDYCIYWNRDALYHNFWRRTRPLWWSLELARAQPLLWTKRAKPVVFREVGNSMTQTTAVISLWFEEKRADDALRFLYISFCGNVHLLNIVAGLGYKMDQQFSIVTILWRRLFVFDKFFPRQM